MRRVHRRLKARLSWTATIGLTIVWMVLWGDLSIAAAALGLVVALVVQVAFPLPDVPEMERFRPFALLRLVAWAGWGLMRASVVVSIGVLAVRRPVQHALVRVPLHSDSPFVKAMTVEVVTLIPGSVIVDLDRHELVMHVFDASSPESIQRARDEVHEAERLLVRAFASREERARYEEVTA
ncbi:Na+/H+ antiporter subunit E [Agrococcus jejuensis]|uniref:Multisubunit sodium/proton antiporter, MrpE subunit n=1 Tax=Agrococcus jejuensis TaxID=399736 RepID=A0A1G8G4F2_9MICO|nr:Na+/H+ antiporter subunit E [Agrococcus jejuensis]SDH89245.1 multisubunit sodium/proton antiporter, MrpE subunit [Agrococcus jejuensis]